MSASTAGESERSLLDRVAAGQSPAWDDLVDRFIGLVYHTIDHTSQALGVRLSPHEAEGLCAEVFGLILSDHMQVIRTFTWQSNFETWLAVRARRHIVWRLHQRLIAERLDAAPAVGTPVMKAEPDEVPMQDAAPTEDAVATPTAPETTDAGKQDAAPVGPEVTPAPEASPIEVELEPHQARTELSDVGRLMDGLPWLDAQVVRLRHIDGKSDEEIAEILDLDPKRVPDILQHAERRVQNRDQTHAEEGES